MTGRERRADEVLGASVTLTGWLPGREADVTDALRQIVPSRAQLAEEQSLELPFVVLERTSIDKAASARDLLVAAGGLVDVEDAWVTRDVAPDVRERPTCPKCGSARTQPFPHAGPGAKKNTRCLSCGQLFRRI